MSLCLGLVSVLFNGLSLCIKKKHVLTMLISLEVAFLSAFCLISWIFFFSDLFYLVLLLVMGMLCSCNWIGGCRVCGSKSREWLRFKVKCF